MKKIALLFLISLFLCSCSLMNLDFEKIPESAAKIEKTQEENKDEIASREGQIKAIADEQENKTNWSAWIILLAVVALASGLSTIGYYGYERIFSSVKQVSVDEHSSTSLPTENRGMRQDSKQEDDDSDDNELRW